MNRITLTLIFISSIINCFAQEFPIDPQVKIGQLDNGVTYYIHNNHYADGKADLYVVYKVGALLEEDNENGMAHFLEHMAFNGSKNFPGNKLIEYLRAVNVDWNANTTMERTIYFLKGILVEQENVLDNCLLAAHDWSEHLSLDESAIENEKNIIREEKRMFSNSDFRIFETLRKDLILNSKYSKHNVIGEEETFMNFTANQLKDFYKRWYRPDMQAIIIVGDLQPEAIENKLIKEFGKIPTPSNKLKPFNFTTNNNSETLISIVKDKEIAFSTFNIEFRHEPLSKEEKGGIDGFVSNYLAESIVAMTNERLEETISKKTNYSNEAEASYDFFMGTETEEAFSISLRIGNNSIKEAIEQFINEIFRIKQHGFTNAEYERAKLTIKSRYLNKLKEKDKIENGEYAEKYVKHFLTGNYIPGIELEYQILESILPQISIDMVNESVREMMPEENIVLFLISPESKEVPQKHLLADWFVEAQNKKLEPYVENINKEPLLKNTPIPGKIIGEKTEDKLGTIVYKLSNGATVVVKQTDFKNNEIIFSATSPGGTSLFPEKDMPNIKLYEEVIDLGGLGNFSKTDLQKKLAGKEVNLVPTINILAEGFKGSTTSNNLEELLQLIYLQFTSPRMDVNAYNAFIEHKRRILQNNNPESTFNNAIRNTVYAKSERMLPLTMEDLSKADYQQIFDWRNDRYADASDFTFIFVGNINPESCKELFERYIASLPSISRKESATNVNISIQPGHVTNVFEYKMENPQALIMNIYSTQVELNQENRLILDVLVEIVNHSLTETIRMQERSSYMVHVSGGVSEYPKGQTILEIFIPTEPGKEENINSLVKQTIDKIALNGPNTEDLMKVIHKLSSKHHENKKNNNYWASSIAAYYATGLNNIDKYIDTLNSIQTNDIKDMASKLTKENLVEVIMKGI